MSDPDRAGPHSSGLLGSTDEAADTGLSEAGLPGPSQMNCSQVDLGELPSPDIVKL